MKWTKLYAKNFLSIGEVELELDGKGLILIEGKNLTNEAYKSNGSGKSSLLDTIVYALFDTTTKGLKADDVINRTAKKNTAVILEGEQDGNKYRIERYRKHPKFKNKVKLFLNDNEITGKSTKATNDLIQKHVGIDYNTFINSIMFSQGSGAGRFATATDKEKKDILENLVNLNTYVVAQDVAKKRVKDKEGDIEDNKRGSERLQWDLANVDTMEKQEKDNYENTKELIQKEQDSIKENTDKMAEYAQHNAANVDITNGEVEQLEKNRDDFTNIDITDTLNKVNAVYQQWQGKSSEYNNITEKKNDLVRQYKEIQSNTHCPVCGKELDNEHREKEMQSIKNNLRDVLVQIQQLEGEVNNLSTQYNDIYKVYEDEKSKYDNRDKEYQDIVKALQDKKEFLRQHEEMIKSYRDKIQASKDTLTKLRTIPEPKSRDKDREALKDKMKAQKEALLSLEKEKSQLEDVVKVFSNSGVKSHVLDLVTPFLNERANKYLSTLSGSDIEITFSTQTRNKNGEMADKFDIQVANSVGGETYQANSEGEKKRIDLAISLAIQDLVMSKADLTTNMVVYDEVFDALDSVGSENVITLLRERLETVGTIFVITHSEHLKPLFEKVITVTKNKQGVSTVQEGVGTS